jgi:ubiquinone/menaquinone biosynthesis C-methylase UbiE
VDHFERIYSQKAIDYDRLLAAEDAYSNLPAALQAIVPFQGKNILDLGTGTGRIPRLFRKASQLIVSMDIQMAMLRQNQHFRNLHGFSWEILQGDMHNTPFVSHWADITIAGWAIGHLRTWFSSEWQAQIGQVIRQMIRTTKSGGHIIIIETLGTGSLAPALPTSELNSYYNYLETTWNFQKTIIRSDYQFNSVQHAIEVLAFFFGQELTASIEKKSWRSVPEWTGIWWKKA